MSQKARWGWVVNATSRTLYHGTAVVSIVEGDKAGTRSDQVGYGEHKLFCPNRVQIRDFGKTM